MPAVPTGMRVLDGPFDELFHALSGTGIDLAVVLKELLLGLVRLAARNVCLETQARATDAAPRHLEADSLAVHHDVRMPGDLLLFHHNSPFQSYTIRFLGRLPGFLHEETGKRPEVTLYHVDPAAQRRGRSHDLDRDPEFDGGDQALIPSKLLERIG